MEITSEVQYFEIRSRLNAFEAWRNGRTSYKTDEVPIILSVTNEERSAVEVWEFCHNIPEKYFLYIKHQSSLSNGSVGEATTWTGDHLGIVIFGQAWTDSFGGRRIPVRIRAINGKRYVGTYFVSSGDYARIRLAKVQ